MKKQLIRQAFTDTVPVMTGYLVLGAGFGVLLKTAGYSLWWALAMSVFIYAGSMQFLAVNLLTGGASLLTVALTTLTVNARHLFYGISMVERYRDMGRTKPYLIFALTDETYSLVCRDGEKPKLYYFLVSLMDHAYWVTGSVLGAVIGDFIPFSTEGIDFALTALFITVFTEQWLSSKQHVSAVIGAVSSVVCLLIFGRDRFLIPAMVLIATLLLGMRRFREAMAR